MGRVFRPLSSIQSPSGSPGVLINASSQRLDTGTSTTTRLVSSLLRGLLVLPGCSLELLQPTSMEPKSELDPCKRVLTSSTHTKLATVSALSFL